MLSIGIIAKVVGYIWKNKKDFFFLGLILCFVVIISVMAIRLQLKRNEIIKLEDKIEYLEYTNEILISEVLTVSNKLFIQQSFTNTTTKIIMITNDFYLEEEDLILRENFKYDFYKE